MTGIFKLGQVVFLLLLIVGMILAIILKPRPTPDRVTSIVTTPLADGATPAGDEAAVEPGPTATRSRPSTGPTRKQTAFRGSTTTQVTVLTMITSPVPGRRPALRPAGVTNGSPVSRGVTEIDGELWLRGGVEAVPQGGYAQRNPLEGLAGQSRGTSSSPAEASTPLPQNLNAPGVAVEPTAASGPTDSPNPPASSPGPAVAPTRQPTATPSPIPEPTATPARQPTTAPSPTPMPGQPAASGAVFSPPERFILVDQDLQMMRIYENGLTIRTIPVSTGAPTTTTLTPPWQGVIGADWGSGAFRNTSLYSDYMWYLFPGPEGSILIHSLPYVQNGQAKVYDRPEALGVQPTSQGCIRISPEDAAWLKGWNPVGVPIQITRWSGKIRS